MHEQGNKEITKERFDEMWSRNPHGFGMMWATRDGVIHTFKSLEESGCYKKYVEVLNDKKQVGDIVLHFRIATQGSGLSNVHPFYVADDLWVCHNGIIGQWSTPEDEKTGLSDTRLFTNYILKSLENPKEDIHNVAIQELISEYISTDKLAFLDSTGTSTIINAEYGTYDSLDENWYSNTSYIPYVAPKRRPLVTKTMSYTTSIECDCCGSNVQIGEYMRVIRGTKNLVICDDCLEYFKGPELAELVESWN